MFFTYLFVVNVQLSQLLTERKMQIAFLEAVLPTAWYPNKSNLTAEMRHY